MKKPIVKMPSQYKIMNMLDPSLRGKTDRSFLKIMARAIHENDNHKRYESKKVNND